MKQRVFIALLIAVSLGSVSCIASSQEEAAAVEVTEQENARQLRIFREALLQGSTEEVRIEAAVELLLRNDTSGREVLIEALSIADNPQAQEAVCKALFISRGQERMVESRQIFLEPLMLILLESPFDQAAEAAKALLIFEYQDIETRLNDILNDSQLDQQSHINAVYAIQVRSEPQALRSLIRLLDNPDKAISRVAANAMQEEFGIPVGTSSEDLKQKSPDEIRREGMLGLKRNLHRVQTERDRWKTLYLSSLDKQYDASDEAGRAKMTLEMLDVDLAALRIWALDKVTQYQAADRDALREKLFVLLSDEFRDVRLQTAKVLNNMSALNPAVVLLEHYEKEKDPEVALAMFEALGEACFYAFSPGSQIELSPDIKAKTLDIAAGYLVAEQTETSRKGAGAIRKILELNDLDEDALLYYLTLLDERFQKTIGNNAVLRADLLSVMADLCGQGMAKAQSGKLYQGYFVEAMAVEDNPPLRLAAIKGMASVDPVKALELLKQYRVTEDTNPAVRKAVIELAGATGSAEDLDWMLGMMNANGQTGQTWQAIKAVCQRQKPTFLIEWLPVLGGNGERGEYVLEILDLAEEKALAETESELLIQIREKIIRWYAEKRAWEQGTAYLNKIEFAIADTPFKDNVLSDIFEIYLYSGNADEMLQILNYELVKENFEANSPIFKYLSSFFDSDTVSMEDKRSVLDKLQTVDAEEFPKLKEFIQGHSDQEVGNNLSESDPIQAPDSPENQPQDKEEQI